MSLPPSVVGARQRAFTLLEILTVIAIIAILASLVIATSGYIQEMAGNKRAKVEINAFESALNDYKLDYGEFPEGDGGSNSTEDVLKALHPKEGKVYLQMNKAFEYKSPADSNYYTNNRLIDPFGNPYRYFYDPETAENPQTGKKNNSPMAPDIWSWGKDGEQRNKGKPDKWISNF